MNPVQLWRIKLDLTNEVSLTYKAEGPCRGCTEIVEWLHTVVYVTSLFLALPPLERLSCSEVRY